MSATPDSTLTDPKQRIADLERQLAECKVELTQRTAERDEALAQQTATAEVLGVINSSPRDLVPVFDAILEKALTLCEAAFGVLYTFDGKSRYIAAHRGVPSAYAEFLSDSLGQPPAPGSTAYRLVQGEDVVRIDDIRTDEDNKTGNPARLAVIELGGACSLLCVALRKDDALLGFFTIYRQEVHPFTDKQIALLESFAAQAVIAMENARLLTETREALEQQTATAEVLQVINSSPGELKPVFETMLEKAVNLCSASFGLLMRYDGDALHAVAHHNSPPKFAEFLATPVHPAPGMASYRILRGEDVVTFGDIAADTSYSAESEAAGQLVELSGARSHLTVALRKDDVLLGVIVIYRQEVLPFTDKEIALVKNFAAQAVIAMENARLITETREALEQQTATAEVLGVINSSPGNLKPVFDAMLDKALRLCEAAYGNLLVFDGRSFSFASVRGDTDLVEHMRRREPFEPMPGVALSRIVQGEDVVEIADILKSHEYQSVPQFRQLADIGGYRSMLEFALRKDKALLGAIAIFRREARPFTDKQIALLQNFAAQAVIAMENARLITETREALEQQTATAEVLGVINNSPGDLGPVFDALLDKALDLCGAAFGNLWTFDGKGFRAGALRRVPAAYIDILSRETVAPRTGTVLGHIAAGKAFAQIPDAALEDAYMSTDARTLVELGGGRTVVGVPLRKETSLLGAITIYRQEVQPFSDKQIALLQNFAAQAVIAMENARLLTETREALEQQTATAEVLSVINSSPGDLAPVFTAILEKAHTLCGAVHGVLVLADGKNFRGVAARGLPEEFAERLTKGFPPADNPVAEPLLGGAQFVQLADMRQIDHPLAQAAASIALRTLVAIALRKEGVLLGWIAAARREVRAFSDQEITLLQSFADQAVIAIENARLLGELRERTEEVAELNRGLEARVAEQVDELGRVGRLKRFLAPQLAELIVSQGDEKILESHRREIVVVFCDLRGYTAFTETAEPEEVLEFLRQYHGALGPLVTEYEGTLDQFSGDGIMVFFNDPVPCPDPAQRAVKMAMAMREAAAKLIAAWRSDGGELGFGVGIAQGYATLGQIGFSDRSGYTAIGTVCNLAARLCAEAKDGQILIHSRVARAVEAVAILENLGDLELRGLRRPVAAFNVAQSTTTADARPNLTVVATEQGA